MNMRIRQPGKIQENLWFLGREESCIYLVEGKNESMIVSGGMSYLVPVILQQFETFGIDEARIKRLLILHSHFDHVGIVPYFKRRNPGLEIYASKRAWEILKMPKAINTINDFSRGVAESMGVKEICAEFDLEWRDDTEGETISEGDRMDLGGLEIQIYETPGHSSCSISAYVPQLKALFASDGGGIPYKETIIAAGNSNYTKYQRSLSRLGNLDLKYVCADHYGYIAGEEAKHFIRTSIQAAQRQRTLIEEAYQRTEDIEATAQEIAGAFLKQNPDYVITPEIMLGVHRQMARNIVREL
jgi:glyoxylase-like metal-dependent hydrolase (beta-lactamase superfamily II)